MGIINYNGVKYLEKCIQAYLNQTYKPIEIIIVDDCSTDGSKQIIEAYEEKYDNIRVIWHKQNSGGASKGIQEIIQEAKGTYFHWIASDDFIATDAIEKFVNHIETMQTDYVYSHFQVIDGEGEKICQWSYTVPTRKELVYSIFLRCSGIIPMNGLYRTQFFREKQISWILYRGNDYSCDTINCLYFIKKGMTYALLNEYIIYYRLHSSNASHNLLRRLQTSITVYEYIIENYDIKYYFPYVLWEIIPSPEEYKGYILGDFYYKKIKELMVKENVPDYIREKTLTKEDLKACVDLYKAEGLRHIQYGLEQGEVYRSLLMELKEAYDTLEV